MHSEARLQGPTQQWPLGLAVYVTEIATALVSLTPRNDSLLILQKEHVIARRALCARRGDLHRVGTNSVAIPVESAFAHEQRLLL